MKNLIIKEFDVMLMTCFCHFIYEFISIYVFKNIHISPIQHNKGCSLILCVFPKDLRKPGYGDRDLNLTFTHKIDSLVSQYNPKFRM